VTEGIARWGVLGTAGINESFLPGLSAASNARLHAIASRRAEKASAEARRWGAETSHGSYEGLLADDAVQAVYLPLPNSLHLEWTLKALQAGKHVLCEKPLALSEGDVTRIAAAAERSGRRVMEAFMYRFAPRWQRARRLIAEGAIGDPRVVRIGFAFKQYPEEYNIRFDPAVGGGIVWDMGCYATSMARDLLGGEPETVVALGHARPGEDVETSVEAILRFADGRAAVTHVSFDYPNPYSQVEVVGTDGWIAMPGTGMRGEPFTRLLLHRFGDEVFLGGVEPVVESFACTDPYQLEIEHFSDCVLTGAGPRYGLDEALGNVRALEAIFRSLRESQVVRVVVPRDGKGGDRA
jgi:predicted dehydrogenase